MSRKTTIVNERVEPDTNIKVQLLESDGIWTVYYKGKPFNLRRITDGSPPIYCKIAFPAPGHAKALCNRLNKLYQSDKFTVIHLKGD